MRTFALSLVCLAATCSAQATQFDVCEGVYATAQYAQAKRHSGVTAEEMTKEVNEQWMPAAVKAKMSEFEWKFIAAGAQFAYLQDPKDSPRAVGRAARAQCWGMLA